MRKVVIKGIYKHFKGDLYLVEDIAIDSETELAITNKDVLQQNFPRMQFRDGGEVTLDGVIGTYIDEDWLNTEYNRIPKYDKLVEDEHAITDLDSLISVMKATICSRKEENAFPIEIKALDMSVDIIKKFKRIVSDKSSDNTVDREDVLALIYDYKEKHSNDRAKYPINYGTLLDMIRWIRGLNPASPWIPVNVTNPLEAGAFYVTVKPVGELEGMDNETCFGTWTGSGWILHGIDNPLDKEVIAWMPAIKPYKEETQ